MVCQFFQGFCLDEELEGGIMRGSIRCQLVLTMIAVSAVAVTGCGKVKEMLEGKAQEAAQQALEEASKAAAEAPAAEPTDQPAVAAPTEAAAAAPAAAGEEDEKQRYINAVAQATCESARDPAKAMEATTKAMSDNGFDQVSYARAARFLADPTVAQAIDAKRVECLAAMGAGAAAGTAAAAEPAKEGEGEGGAPDEKKPEKSPLAGEWTGRLMGSHTAMINFTVDAKGKKANGTIQGSSATFNVPLRGDIMGNNQVILNGRGGGGASLMLHGTLDAKGRRMNGTWKGTVGSQGSQGTWASSFAR